MIALDERQLAQLRALWRSPPVPSLLLPPLLPDDVRAALRERVIAAGLTDFWIADRGRYRRNDTHVETELFDGLRDLAGRLVDAPLVVRAARWAALARGDYALYKDDAGAGSAVEVIVDLSARATGEAEVMYSDGGAFTLAVPQRPGAIGFVARDRSVMRYSRYLGCRVGDAEVVRLILSLSSA
jgi:hypothetical protein